MPDPQSPPPFIPPRHSERELKAVGSAPRWILREAAEEFGLNPYDLAVLTVIVDSLDPAGIAKMATTLIAHRTGMHRNQAAAAIRRLVAHNLLYERDKPSRGQIMRYSIPRDAPWRN